MIHHTFFFPFGGLLWIVLIVILVAYLWRGREYGRDTGSEDILAERFAKGEITEAEYIERLAVLKKNRS